METKQYDPRAASLIDKVPTRQHEAARQELPTASISRSESNERTHSIPSIDKLYKDAAASFYNLLDTVPQSREASIARTKLDEAIMWATKTNRF